MQKWINSYIVVSMITVIATPAIAQTGTVKLTITGIENTKGKIEVGIFKSKSTFPVLGKEEQRAQLKPSESGNVIHVFKNLPDGTYAIAVLHDENENQKLDTFIGKPKEKLGFSNNVYGILGPPDFDKASFKVLKGEVVDLTINL